MQYSLFIGRYQPLHEGHIKLMRHVLEEDKKNVCIAIRSTPKDNNNPFSIEQRCAMIQKEFGKEISQGRVAVCVIPDITEVCYGRDVGWGVREITLKNNGDISGTKIREQLRKEGKL
ncbi:MAG: adenylyltransferase/cytidyltransferase family protein [Pseudomonadota bacterium]